MKSRRGIALVLVLMLAAVMAALSGAFIALNRADFGLTADVRGESLTRAAGHSAASYACSRLSEDPDWGEPSGSNSGWTQTFSSTSLNVWERENSGVFSVVGVLDRASVFQMHFQAAAADVVDFAALDPRSVVDNPDSPAAWTPSADLTSARWASTNNFQGTAGTVLNPPRSGFRPVPGRATNLQILAFAGDASKRFDATLHRPSLISYGILSQGELGVGLESDGKWSIESADPFQNEVGARSGVHAPDVLAAGSTLEVAAGGAKIKSGGRIPLINSLTILPGPTASVSGNGRVVGDGTDDQSEKDALLAATGGEFLANQSVPSITTATPLAAVSYESLASGSYVFVADDTVEYYDVGGTLVETYVGSVTGTSIKLENSEMRIPEGVDISVAGDLSVSRSPTHDAVPYISLGQAAGGGPGSQPSLIEIQGKATLEAAVVGQGALTTTGDISLRGKSAVSAPADLGVALYSGGDVNFSEVDPLLASASGAKVLPGDWEVLNYSLANLGGDLIRWNHPSRGLNTWNTVDPVSRSVHIRQGRVNMDPIATFNDGGVLPLAQAALTERALDLGLISQGQDYTALAFPGVPNVGSVEAYVGVSLYLESLAAGSPNPALLAPALPVMQLDIATPGMIDQRIEAMMDTLYANKPQGQTFFDFIGQITANPVPPQGIEVANPRDAEFRGVVYAEGNVLANMGGHQFRVDGALAAQGDILFEQVGELTNRYNPTYIEQFTEAFNVSSSATGRVRVVYFAEY